MPIVSWREQMSLGYPPLDGQHQSFLSVINQASAAVKNNDFRTIDALFEECYNYVRNHFTLEEDVMERIRFPDMEAHVLSHQVFIKNISEFRQKYDIASADEKPQIAIKTVNFLNVWFLGHILSRDKLLKPYLVRLRNLPPRMDY